ncbi:site-specific integrase [Terribacillus halophilus]
MKFTNPITKEITEVSKGGFKTKKEAQSIAVIHEQRLATGHEVITKDELLSEYLRIWITEYKKDNVRKNTYILHERNIEKHIIPYFQLINLKEVTALRYQKFINHLKAKGYSTRTIEIIHQTMYSATQTAVKPLKKISENPCEDVTLPRNTRRMADKIQYIDSDRISDFLFHARRDNYMYYMFFKTLIETEMRKDEALALQRSDIDLKKGYITVNKTLDFQAKPGEDLFGLTKTYEPNRKIKLTNTLTKELATLGQAQ